MDADLNRLADVRAWARHEAEGLGFSAPELAEWELAVTEAVSNVVKHGYGGRGGHSLELHSAVEDESLLVTVVDDAPAFDPTAEAPHELQETREQGLGLYLMETVMDDISWRRRPGGGNELMLRRHLPPR